jgi:hypothetical protein
MQPLIGHVSPDTAYTVLDYPYGFRLRCTIRSWIEFKPGHGFRLVTQTSNPKRPGLVWNTPKAGTYAPVLVLVRDEATGRVSTAGLGHHATTQAIDAYEAAFAPALTPEHRAALRSLRALDRANGRLAYTTDDDGGPRQTPAEQAAIVRAVVADELRRSA